MILEEVGMSLFILIKYLFKDMGVGDNIFWLIVLNYYFG